MARWTSVSQSVSQSAIGAQRKSDTGTKVRAHGSAGVAGDARPSSRASHSPDIRSGSGAARPCGSRACRCPRRQRHGSGSGAAVLALALALALALVLVLVLAPAVLVVGLPWGLAAVRSLLSLLSSLLSPVSGCRAGVEAASRQRRLSHVLDVLQWLPAARAVIPARGVCHRTESECLVLPDLSTRCQKKPSWTDCSVNTRSPHDKRAGLQELRERQGLQVCVARHDPSGSGAKRRNIQQRRRDQTWDLGAPSENHSARGGGEG